MTTQSSKNDDDFARKIEEDMEAEAEKEEEEVEEEEVEEEEKDRRWLLLLLLLLLCALCCVCGLFFQYIRKPAPLPELVPFLPGQLEVSYAPHYLFSIYGVDKPVGVTASPDGGRIYVAETGGERMVKMFNREGDPLGSFVPPLTTPGERAPVYLDTDSSGRVFVSDRVQHGVYVYDEAGTYLDTILAPNLTLSEYVSKHAGGLQPGDVFTYEWYEREVNYQKAGGEELTLPPPDPYNWSPLGVRFDDTDRMLLTDVEEDTSAVRLFGPETIMAPSWQEFDPPEDMFGSYGRGNGQFLFPNSAVSDSRGRIYVTDGNNGRISVWDNQGSFLFHLGQVPGDGKISLPRGAFIDDRDRLYVVDAVAHDVKVYNVAQENPSFLYFFGGFGRSDGEFNFPIDIAIDDFGRLYVADRENNRVQVWSY